VESITEIDSNQKSKMKERSNNPLNNNSAKLNTRCSVIRYLTPKPF